MHCLSGLDLVCSLSQVLIGVGSHPIYFDGKGKRSLALDYSEETQKYIVGQQVIILLDPLLCLLLSSYRIRFV